METISQRLKKKARRDESVSGAISKKSWHETAVSAGN